MLKVLQKLQKCYNNYFTFDFVVIDMIIRRIKKIILQYINSLNVKKTRIK